MKFFLVASALVALACGQMPDMKKSFDMADTDMDGFINQTEFDNAHASIDTDMNGKINASEFVIAKMAKGMSKNGALFTFFKMDNNSDSVIDDDEMDAIFHMIDMDNDDMIDFMEYSKMANMTMKYSKHAEMMAKKLSAMVDAADSDDDAMLTGDEMWAIVSGGDMDGDGMLDMDEFNTYWMNHTGASEEKSKRLFKIFDGDMDGKFGGKDEKAGIYKEFDYNKDGVVSKEEFINAMLFIFAKIAREMMHEHKMGMMDSKAMFNMVDTDMDGYISHAEFDKAVMRMDADMNGNVNTSEYVMAEMAQGMSKNGALFMFFKMDNNSDFMLDDDEMDAVFHMIDMDDDDKISFMEHSKMMKKSMKMIKGVEAGTMRLSAMVDAADSDDDDMLTGDEMWAIVSGGDMDGDGMLDMDEFNTYWMNHTGASEEKSKRLFKIFDSDMDGKFGGKEEKAGIYKAFDYNNDSVVSKEEFMNAMIFNFAKIVREMMHDHMMDKMGKTNKMPMMDLRAMFDMVDNDTDGMISKMEFEALYHKFDDNMDGSVNASEFVAHYTKTGMSVKGSLYIFFRMDDNEDSKISNSEVDDTFNAFDGSDDDMVSFTEYAMVMNKTIHELTEAAKTGAKLDVMFGKADADMDGSLTRTEMRTVFGAADADKDGVVSEAEFKTYWQTNTGEPDSRTDLFFGYLDQDDDGFFGNDNEDTNSFDGFDYNDDDMVTKDEFDNSMLFLFARIMGDLDAAAMVKDVVGYFY